MKKIKILNLYAGIGGNRKLWPDDEIEVTAVEWDEEIAGIYKHFFPNDLVIVADAHQYLLDHYSEYDFIWSSPPCPSHSIVRKVTYQQNKPIYPDMKLYEEILFLQYYFKGLWVVENVIPFYEPLIRGYKVGSHLYWANFIITDKNDVGRCHDAKINILQKRKGFDLNGIKTKHDKKKLLRNCVEPEFGLYIFNMAFKEKQKTLF